MQKNERLKVFYEGAAIIGAVEDKKPDGIDVEKHLNNLTRTKDVFTVKISGVRKDAVTVNLFGEYMGIIPDQQVSTRQYIKNSLEELINQTIQVCCTGYDTKTKTATLSRTLAIKKLRKDFLAEILPKLDEINKDGINYKKYATKFEESNDPFLGKYPIVKAKVVNYIKKDGRIIVIVNVAGVDILGNMELSMFDYKYIYNPEEYLETYMKPNTVIDVALLAYYDNAKEGNQNRFVVSRRFALPNPWIGIEKKVKVNDIIVVKALQKRETHFFAEYDNFALDIKCKYPNKPKKVSENELYGRRIVTEGNLYKVKVTAVSEKDKLLLAEYQSEV